MKKLIINKCDDLKSFIKVNYYNIKNINDRNYKNELYFVNNNESKEICLLGNKLSIAKYKNYMKINEELGLIFKDLYIFSYEKEISKEIKNDIGWGCTFRCGQMFLFYFLKKNYNFSKKKTLSYFSNDKCNYFSLYSFVNHAKIFFDFDIGNFSSIYSFFIYFSHIHQTYKLKYFDDIIISKNDTIFFNEIDESKNKKLIVFNISVSIGRDSSGVIKDWKRIMSNKYYYGMFGGINKSCYYIIGWTGSNFYFLDPHSIYKKNQNCDLLIKKESINKFTNNFGIIFYTKNDREFNELKKDLENVNLINFLNYSNNEEELVDLNCSFENNEFLWIE